MEKTKNRREHVVQNLQVSVLFYIENGQYAAHCLEMDLRGWGNSFKEAKEELVGMIRAQVSFALQMRDISLLDRPADEKYFRLFRETKARALRAYPKTPAKSSTYADYLPIQSELKKHRLTFTNTHS